MQFTTVAAFAVSTDYDQTAQKYAAWSLIYTAHFAQTLLTKALFKINPFPDKKQMTLSKLKAFANDKINVTKMIISVFDRVQNIMEKGENAGY